MTFCTSVLRFCLNSASFLSFMTKLHLVIALLSVTDKFCLLISLKERGKKNILKAKAKTVKNFHLFTFILASEHHVLLLFLTWFCQWCSLQRTACGIPFLFFTQNSGKYPWRLFISSFLLGVLACITSHTVCPAIAIILFVPWKDGERDINEVTSVWTN